MSYSEPGAVAPDPTHPAHHKPFFMEISTATAAFPRLKALREGSGARTVVLLHGFPENSGLWREVAPLLSKEFTVIMPDLPGAGGSRLPEEPLTLEAMADAVNALLDAASEQGRVVLAGHSMGGYAAMAFLEKYPERLAGISLIHSSAAPDDDDKKAARRKTIRLLQNGGQRPFVDEMIPALFSPASRAAMPAVIEEQKQRAMRLSPEAMIAFYEAMISRPDRRALLSNAGIPAQFVLGHDDTNVPIDKGMTQALMPCVSFVETYPSTGHMGMLEQPERLAADLARFATHCFEDAR